MYDKGSLRILLVCDQDYDLLPLRRLIRQSDQSLKLTTFHLQSDCDEYPVHSADVVLLDLSGMLNHGIDPADLDETLFHQVPVILIGEARDGAQALEGLRSGAQDWLIHGHLNERPLPYVLELAKLGFSHQRKLIVSHARYQTVVEDQSEYICRFLPDCTLTFVNQAYANYRGKSAAELEGTSLLALTLEQDRNNFQRKIAALTPESPVASYDRRVVIDGDVYWQHWSDKAFFDSNGVMLEIQSVGSDITERRCKEQEALDSQSRFQSLYQNAPVIMQELDATGRILSVNRCWSDALGYDADEVTGSRAYQYVRRGHRRTIARNIETLQTCGWVKDVHCQLICREGQRIDLLVSATSELDANNELLRILLVGVDITHQRQAERLLNQEKERLSSILKAIDEAVISADESEHIEYLNPAAERLTGWALDDARGKQLKQVFKLLEQPVSHPAAEAFMTNSLLSGAAGSSRGGVLIGRSGRRCHIRSSVVPSLNVNGTKKGTTLVFKEVHTATAPSANAPLS